MNPIKFWFWLVSNVSKEHQLEVAGKLAHLQRVVLWRGQDLRWLIDTPKNFLDDGLVLASSRFQFFQLDEQPVLVLDLRFPARRENMCDLWSLLCIRATATDIARVKVKKNHHHYYYYYYYYSNIRPVGPVGHRICYPMFSVLYYCNTYYRHYRFLKMMYVGMLHVACGLFESICLLLLQTIQVK